MKWLKIAGIAFAVIIVLLIILVPPIVRAVIRSQIARRGREIDADRGIRQPRHQPGFPPIRRADQRGSL
jgi:hypothetical protein